MAIFGIKIPRTIAGAFRLPKQSVTAHQSRVLKKLLKKARYTEFGQNNKFDQILMSSVSEKAFQQIVPIYDYSKLYKEYWHKTLDGVPDVCWPGKIKFFALSSGTSEAASKYIPITKDLIKSNVLTSKRQLFTLANYQGIKYSAIRKGWLMLGGSTTLQNNGTYYAGDLSGIQQKNIPFWFQSFYKPGKKIAKEKDWEKKINEIVENAPNWDIGFIVGVPAWLQICIEKIIKRYNLNTIHDIWPNLSFYVHGGVSMEPYKKGFEKLLAKPLTYIETYLASEGFLGYQSRQFSEGMQLAYNNNIFYEFIPFDDNNFDMEGNVKPDARALLLHEVEEHKDYAILISTNAGSWRYLIGDTIKFTNKQKCEIAITGRTKHFLSLVGEHLSVDNMNQAISCASKTLNISIPEFTVAGLPHGNFFAHKWYICTDCSKVTAEELTTIIDNKLMDLNDDYAVERKHALQNVSVEILPQEAFFKFLEKKGKIGSQNKFPRVLKGKMLEEWVSFLNTFQPEFVD